MPFSINEPMESKARPMEEDRLKFFYEKEKATMRFLCIKNPSHFQSIGDKKERKLYERSLMET